MSLQDNIKRRVEVGLAEHRREQEERRILQERLENERKKLLQRRTAHMSRWLKLPSDFSVSWTESKGHDCKDNEYRVSALISYQGVTAAVNSYETLSMKNGRHNESPKWVFEYFSKEHMIESEWQVTVEYQYPGNSNAKWKICTSEQEVHAALEDTLVKKLITKEKYGY